MIDRWKQGIYFMVAMLSLTEKVFNGFPEEKKGKYLPDRHTLGIDYLFIYKKTTAVHILQI